MILKLFVGVIEHIFNQSFWDQMPIVQQEFEPFGLMLSCDTCSAVFSYNEEDADPEGDLWGVWCSFMKNNRDEITNMKIISNNGIEVFSGAIDEEAEIRYSKQDNTLTFEFLSDISKLLDQKFAENHQLSLFLSAENVGTNNPGALVIAGILQNMVTSYLPGYTLSIPDAFLQSSTALDYVYGFLTPYVPPDGSVESYVLSIPVGENTYASVLKIFCILGYCRLILSGDTISIFSYEEIQADVEPNGILYNVEENTVHSNVVDSIAINEDLLVKIFYSWGSITTSFALDPEVVKTHVADFYSALNTHKTIERNYDGINSNLAAGDNMINTNKRMIVTNMERDLAFIDDIYQPVKFKAVEIV